MRYFKIVSIALSIVTVSALAGLAFEDLSAQRGFGVGMQVTFPMRPPQALPASGMSVRVWLWDRFGIEGDFFVVGSSLSFTPRLFLKVINLEIADLYVGGGVSFFTYAPPQEALMLYIPVQGVVGLEMRLTPQIALNGEIGVFGLWRDAGRGDVGTGSAFLFLRSPADQSAGSE
jgi:hypothetical protein